MLETLIFQRSYAQTVFMLNTHPINGLSKAGAALVNTISSHYRLLRDIGTVFVEIKLPILLYY